ncbi:thermonuclease family protein [Pedobacter arcticus]|uniref:thermonuclease family protein n=1 Tax=Pedobacter arcticus TaxID=752140 RepID=UPI00036EA614|nr:thermonuclease family protein [Pedobacter arcticus]
MAKFSFRTAFLIIVFVQFSCSFYDEARDEQTHGSPYLTVTRVVDGDTFWADNGTEKGVKIRLIGVDAPESRKTGRKEIGYYGKEAKEYLKKLLNGKSVKLISDVDSLDRYGRTLAYVYLEDGTFVNAELVKNGYATVMTIPPNVRYADLFVELQKQARQQDKGLWAR